MRKKIATITFHASYNYGSNLQAYALQEYIKHICKNDVYYSIINLRTPIQKKMYESIFEQKGLKNYLKSIILMKYKKQFKNKQVNFENFIQSRLNITKEYSSLDELLNEDFDYDYFISGSDQPWNLQAKDFDWSNYLEFVKSGKKISYAVSFGPKSQTWNDEERDRVRRNLETYDFISVREQGSFNNVKQLIGKDAEINVDPTMLLSNEDWDNIISDEPILKKDYILFYDLKGKNDDIKLVKYISDKLKMPVVITRYMGINVHFSNFEKHYDCGPLEFLNLLKNSKLVLSSSFHGTVFSIIYSKPFFAINGDVDFRIKTLLEKMNLSDRSININDKDEKLLKTYDVDFKAAKLLINEERKKSEMYLKKVLDVEN